MSVLCIWGNWSKEKFGNLSKATMLIYGESRNWNACLSHSFLHLLLYCVASMDEESFGLYFISSREQVKSSEHGSDTIRNCSGHLPTNTMSQASLEETRLEAQKQMGNMCGSPIDWTKSPVREASLCEWKVGQRFSSYRSTWMNETTVEEKETNVGPRFLA